ARPTRLRTAPDERPAHRREHPGVRRGRRPAGLPQLGEPPAREGTRRGVEPGARGHPPLRAAHPRHADVPLRRTGLAAHALDQRHQPGRVPARTVPHPVDPRPGTAVRGGAGPVPHRDPQLADVVLPAATWGEKTRTSTHADRTVHLSDKAVQPPGEARADLDILLDFAARMDFRDKDGAPLIGWHDAESAFAAWQRCSAGRPCDYTGLSYEKLRHGSGIQWPCTDDAPDGTARLYTDGITWAHPDLCESYGRDLV